MGCANVSGQCLADRLVQAGDPGPGFGNQVLEWGRATYGIHYNVGNFGIDIGPIREPIWLCTKDGRAAVRCHGKLRNFLEADC